MGWDGGDCDFGAGGLRVTLDGGSLGTLARDWGERGDWRGLLIFCGGDFTCETIIKKFFLLIRTED